MPRLSQMLPGYFLIIFLTGLKILVFQTPSVRAADLSFPVEPCEQAWKEIPSTDFLFDFTRDSVFTSKGNLGYLNYINRMKNQGVPARKHCYKAWTVFIYITATEDLIKDIYADLLELETGEIIDGEIKGETSIGVKAMRGSSLKTDFIVQLDIDSSDEIQRLHMFETSDSKFNNLTQDDFYSLIRKNIQSPIVPPILDKKSSSTPKSQKQRLEEFLKWGMTEYPSTHVMIIIGGHGQGWTALPSKMLTVEKQNLTVLHGRFGGVGLEESSGYLTIPDLKDVFDAVQSWSDQAMQKRDPIDVLLFDACLMQSTEVTGHLCRCTKFICGSSDVDPSAGCPYGSLSCHLNSDLQYDGAMGEINVQAHAEGEVRNLAWMIPKLYEEAYSAQGSLQRFDHKACTYLTQCSIDSQRLERLLHAMNDLGYAFIRFFDEFHLSPDPIRMMAIKSIMQKGPFYLGGTQDLGTFFKNLDSLLMQTRKNHAQQASPETLALMNTLSHAHKALVDSIVNSALGEKYSLSPDPWNLAGPMGLSIWMPERDDQFYARFQDYSLSELYQRPGWKAFMLRMYPKR